MSSNDNSLDLFCALSEIGLLFSKLTLNTLSSFGPFGFIEQVKVFEPSLITDVFDVLKLFFLRKLPDPFSLLRRDVTR